MTNKNFTLHLVLCTLGLALMALFAGCIVQPVGGRAYAPAPVYYRRAPAPVYYGPPPATVYVPAPAPAVVVQAPVAIQDGLIYYPSYEMYYDPGLQIYWYNQGGVWLSGPRPYGVSVDVLIGSPFVRLGFRGSPAGHHGDVVRMYPRNWQPPGRR
jgi:hypothetical protein